MCPIPEFKRERGGRGEIYIDHLPLFFHAISCRGSEEGEGRVSTQFETVQCSFTPLSFLDPSSREQGRRGGDDHDQHQSLPLPPHAILNSGMGHFFGLTCVGLPMLTSKASPANLLEGFGVSTVFVPQLSIMHIVDFNEI